jgi:hypothetical protein
MPLIASDVLMRPMYFLMLSPARPHQLRVYTSFMIFHRLELAVDTPLHQQRIDEAGPRPDDRARLHLLKSEFVNVARNATVTRRVPARAVPGWRPCSPARTSLSSIALVTPWASMIETVQPCGASASNLNARRRSAL